MTLNVESAIDILAALGQNPAVAFHEDPVAATVRAFLQESGLKYENDEFGNIICRLAGKQSRGNAAGAGGPHGPSRLRSC